MSGFVSVMAPCCSCRQVFTFHPNKVPSVRIKGVRQPVCRTCIKRANVQRQANGLEPFPILPGSYEAAEESSVHWEDEG